MRDNTTYWRYDNPGARFGNKPVPISAYLFSCNYEYIGYGDDEGYSELYRHKNTGEIYSLNPANNLTKVK